MSSAALPADPSKEGNVWCDVCSQSLAAGRAAAHLVTKKHTDAAARAQASTSTGGAASPTEKKKSKASTSANTSGGSPTSTGGASPTDDARPAAPAEAKRKSKPADADAELAITLPRDPDDASRYWCGICQVSLGAAQAAKHLATKSHQARAASHLTAAMKGARVS